MGQQEKRNYELSRKGVLGQGRVRRWEGEVAAVALAAVMEPWSHDGGHSSRESE